MVSITFDYIETAHVACTVDGVSTTFTLSSGGTVATLSSAPALGASVEFRRTTSQSARLTDYQAGSVLKESDLDTDSQQAFFMGQEAIDNAGDAIQISSTNFQWDALNKRITNVADPIDNSDVVINLIGILFETRKQKFYNIHSKTVYRFLNFLKRCFPFTASSLRRSLVLSGTPLSLDFGRDPMLISGLNDRPLPNVPLARSSLSLCSSFSKEGERS